MEDYYRTQAIGIAANLVKIGLVEKNDSHKVEVFITVALMERFSLERVTEHILNAPTNRD